MKLSEMEPGIRYRVTKGSRDNFEVGEQVTMNERREIRIFGIGIGGWLDEIFWKRLKAEVAVDTVWHTTQAVKLHEEARQHELIVKRFSP